MALIGFIALIGFPGTAGFLLQGALIEAVNNRKSPVRPTPTGVFWLLDLPGFRGGSWRRFVEMMHHSAKRNVA